MKRMIAFLLVLCTLFLTVALADDCPPLRVAGSMPVTDYWKDLGITTVQPNYHWVTGVPLMRLDNAPDLYDTSSYDCDMRALKGAGVLADLSGSKVIRDAVSRMRPEVQSLVTTESGQIVAVPLYAATNPLYWRQEAWDMAGLADEDVPQSYTELLNFADAWLARIAKHPQKEVCFTDTCFFGGNEPYSYTLWLTDILINTWEMQAYTAGEPLNFDTPEFIALLERTKSVGKQLSKAEPSEKKRQKMVSLFWNLGGGSGFDGWFNGGRNEGFSHTVPFRITRDQPVLMRGFATLNMVRAASKYTDELTVFLEPFIPSGKGVHSVELFTKGVEPGAYGTDYVERISAGWIKDRNEYTGIVSFAPMRTFFLYESALMKFIQDKLPAEKLVQIISKPKDDPNE